MFSASGNIDATQTTSHKIVLPFYGYAALSFLASALLLWVSAPAFTGHYFHPQILAVTHLMALGWGTMIIFGAGHQLVPVLIEGKLYSRALAWLSFGFAAAGIPVLVYAFYVFDTGLPAQWGGFLILLSVLAFAVNVGVSMARSGHDNIHALFVFTAVLWLLVTAGLGLALLFNFSVPLLTRDSLYYLPVHAHTGIVGWFLLLIFGVGSRLIPMFLLSKYTNAPLLRRVYYLVNAAMLGFIALYLGDCKEIWMFFPALMLLSAVLMFVYFCYRTYRERIRRQVDEQMKISLLSVGLLVLPVVFLLLIIGLLAGASGQSPRLTLTYGFLVFFGWITAIILGMTFKTLPFIIWNKVYHRRTAPGKMPGPKDLYSDALFKGMILASLSGLVIFAAGLLTAGILLLKTGAALWVLAAALYNLNVVKVMFHKPVTL